MKSFRETLEEGRRGRPRIHAKPEVSDDGDEALGPDNGREPDQHIVVQMHKAIHMDGKKEVEFDNGDKVNIHPSHALKFLNQYMAAKPADRMELQQKAGKSHADFKEVIG